MSPLTWILCCNAGIWSATTALLLARRSRLGRQATGRWLAAAAMLVLAWAVLIGALRLMSGVPRPLDAWLAGALVLPALGAGSALLLPDARVATAALREALAFAGFAGLAAGAYLVFVAGLSGTPRGHEREVLITSLVAALVVTVLAAPTRRRLVAIADGILSPADVSVGEVVLAFGTRMSRAVPMDELLLQLAESLYTSVARGGVEIWTGGPEALTRTVSVPIRPPSRLPLAARDRAVIATTRIGGPAWCAVWLPSVAADDGDLRAVPIAHLGTLHGLLVVRRAGGSAPYTDDDEQALVEVAHQLGLALHNVRLDSALQASLAELARRNEELQASRLRIVTAADESRRRIERDLHDGAQQHLVALAVKLTLARQLMHEEDPAAPELLDGLRADVQAAIGELRELAHGIYPPLLRDRGLGEALRAAAARCPLPCTVAVELPGRYPEPVETAAYFCCLEAMQNAAKYAGADATVSVRVFAGDGALCVELADDGCGFDPRTTARGSGLENMADRLGALGGGFELQSAVGSGTTLRARIPDGRRS